MSKFIGVAGPSGAGKSTITKLLKDQLDDCERIKLDDYFNDVNGFPKIDGQPNWDIPNSLNLELLYENLQGLRRGEIVNVPCFHKPTLERTFRAVSPKTFILVEGFLLFYDERIRDLFDLKIYVDISEDEAIQRRTGRDPERDEYIRTVVIPNYRMYGEPTKKFADYVVDGSQSPELVTTQILNFIRQ